MSGQLKEVRERISSVTSTQQITKAMKMVSAAKLRHAQNAITMMRPYADKLDHMIKNILSNIEGGAQSTYGTKREINKAAVIVITSNRGLCGGFNSSIAKEVYKTYEELSAITSDKNLTFYFIGKKGYDALKRRLGDAELNRDYVDLFSDLTFENVAAIANQMMEQFKNGELDRVDVCYSKFKNAAVQLPISTQFLPVKNEEVETAQKGSKADYIFEPSKEKLLEELIPTILQTTFHKYCLDTHAAEHGARMTAMDKATENAQDLLKELKISYNKARQASITNEILEIVGGAAALES